MNTLVCALMCVFISSDTVDENKQGIQEMNLSSITENAMTMILDFGPEEEVWRNIDDVVMGGRSTSRMQIDGNVAAFEGELSLENNGGFGSVRSRPVQRELAGYEGIRVRVKGDGRKYQFRIRTGSAFGGPSFQFEFPTKTGVWSEIDFPFDDFKAAFRGRALPDHPPIDAAAISTLGFLIADKQPGPFRLEIDWIKAFREHPEVTSD